MSTLERAIALAARAHEGQTDKVGEPYILHPIRVMLRVEGEEARIAAVLHDVIEETSLTLADLKREGFSERVAEIVQALTHSEEEDYEHAVRRAAAHPMARIIKVADLEDNIQMSSAINALDKLQKYEHALEIVKSYG
jgi:(p)ppGpp synthase/HD superfamily hydrolase